MFRHHILTLWALQLGVFLGTASFELGGVLPSSSPAQRRQCQILMLKRRASVCASSLHRGGSRIAGVSVFRAHRTRRGIALNLSERHDDSSQGVALAADGIEEPRKPPPRHVAFICDGNSRWAKRRNLPASVGHAMGADSVVSAVNNLRGRGVRVCTFYGFSTENWSRMSREINDIWSAMEQTAKAFYGKAVEEHVQVRILGDLNDDRIPDSLRDTLMQLEKDTGGRGEEWDADGMTVCLAVNYGGRRDILNASLKLAEAMSQGKILPSQVDEDTLGTYLCTSGIPDPDLIIRTGGEQRLSNFLLWDLAYSELYFTDVLWPDFDLKCVTEALSWYSGRSRRFGGRKSTSQ